MVVSWVRTSSGCWFSLPVKTCRAGLVYVYPAFSALSYACALLLVILWFRVKNMSFLEK